MTGAEAAKAKAYIGAIEPPRRRQEARALLTIFTEVSGYGPRLWSGRMIGFGSYAYTYASGHSGVSLATGFAISKAHITIYNMPGYTEFPEIVARIGKYRSGKSCIYFTRLEHADPQALRDLIAAGLADLAKKWPIEPT